MTSCPFFGHDERTKRWRAGRKARQFTRHILMNNNTTSRTTQPDAERGAPFRA